MPDPNRLNELKRQRALMQDHLAWLDREIAAESGPAQPASPVQTPPATATPPATGVVATASRLSATPFVAAEKIMSQYRLEPDATKSDVRKGCFIYLALASLVIILGVVALYFYSQSKH